MYNMQICKYENQDAKKKQQQQEHELQQEQGNKAKQSAQLQYFIFTSVVNKVCGSFDAFTIIYFRETLA